jgi:hypothetical protein
MLLLESLNDAVADKMQNSSLFNTVVNVVSTLLSG